MTNIESPIPREWYVIGNRELSAAKILLAEHGSYLSISGMLLQQALEKYLKGYLLSKGWKLVHIHDLGRLLKDLVDHEPDFQEFAEACLRITDFYLEDRYPLGAAKPIEKAELEALAAQAEDLIDRIRSRAQHTPSS